MKGRRTSNSKCSFSVYINVENEHMLKRKSVSFTSSHVSYVRQIEELVNSYFMVCGGFLVFGFIPLEVAEFIR